MTVNTNWKSYSSSSNTRLVAERLLCFNASKYKVKVFDFRYPLPTINEYINKRRAKPYMYNVHNGHQTNQGHTPNRNISQERRFQLVTRKKFAAETLKPIELRGTRINSAREINRYFV